MKPFKARSAGRLGAVMGWLRMLVMGVTGLVCAVASANEGGPAGSEKLMKELNKAVPTLPIERITPAQLPGFYALELMGGQILYGTADGRFLIAGDLYQVAPDGLINLAEAQRTVKRSELMAAQPLENMVVFSPEGETKDFVSVFTDVDCGYCRKLHQEMAEINALGIEVRYLAYPRAGLNSPTYLKIQSAWCADDPNVAITALKSGQTIEDVSCDNPIADQYALGNQVGVQGTPAIITSDGRLLPGYMPAAALAEAIGLN